MRTRHFVLMRPFNPLKAFGAAPLPSFIPMRLQERSTLFPVPLVIKQRGFLSCLWEMTILTEKIFGLELLSAMAGNWLPAGFTVQGQGRVTPVTPETAVGKSELPSARAGKKQALISIISN